ncbi:MAG: hypothetical protein JNM94_07460 [Phycisphaerae bacterium]|nr:hypothetical protein [Phycisphaerae bacterium]
MKQTFSIAASLLLAATVSTATPTAHAVDSAPLPQIAVPKVYIVPMKGQMGTDVEPEEYDAIVEDIKKVKPDIIVIQLDASDEDRKQPLDLSEGRANRAERSIPKINEYRDLALKFRTELRDIPQVMWVNDAIGFSALMAFAWPEMYMGSDARIWGLQQVTMLAMGWEDPDVAAKMMAAWTAAGKGFLELGGYPLPLGDALLFPDRNLSARWEGRKVKWTNDVDGTWIIDDNPKRTPIFTAQLAEDSGLCDGTADSLDDLMFILGYREYTKIDSGEKAIDGYIKRWRKAFERCEELLQDVGDEGGGDERALAKQLKTWESILSEMERYPAVEYRLGRQYGLNKGAVKREIEQIKNQLQQIRNRERGNRTNGGNAPGGAGLGGGGNRR